MLSSLPKGGDPNFYGQLAQFIISKQLPVAREVTVGILGAGLTGLTVANSLLN
jgi:hypothetical protein